MKKINQITVGDAKYIGKLVKPNYDFKVDVVLKPWNGLDIVEIHDDDTKLYHVIKIDYETLDITICLMDTDKDSNVYSLVDRKVPTHIGYQIYDYLTEEGYDLKPYIDWDSMTEDGLVDRFEKHIGRDITDKQRHNIINDILSYIHAKDQKSLMVLGGTNIKYT